MKTIATIGDLFAEATRTVGSVTLYGSDAYDFEHILNFDDWREKSRQTAELVKASANIREALEHLKVFRYVLEEEIASPNVKSPALGFYVCKDTKLCKWLEDKELPPIVKAIGRLEKLMGVFGDQPLQQERNAPQNSIPEKAETPAGKGLREVALRYAYLKQPITETNFSEIAEKETIDASRKLFQHYSFYKNRQNRIAPESTPKKTKNKLSLMEKVCEWLPENLQKTVTNEIAILRENL